MFAGGGAGFVVVVMVGSAKARRDLDTGRDGAACEPVLKIGVINKRGFFDEVG